MHKITPSRLVVFVALCLATVSGHAELPISIATLRPAGPLNLTLRTDAAREITLNFEPQYTTQTFGDRLNTVQLEKLDLIRAEAPEKFEMLQSLFPRQIAEYLLRTPTRAMTAASPAGVTIESSASRGKADFDSAEKDRVLRALQQQYSPYRPVTMSLTGNLLSLNGRLVSEHLGSEARAARRSREALAHERYDALVRESAQWREGQISGHAYAGTIKSFLRDPRLATFTPEETRRAYAQIFGRDLQTDLEADRLAAETGHPLTYNELAARKK